MTNLFESVYRTHTCGELRPAHIGNKVTIAGWVQSVRNAGTLLWVDLRDRYGVTQVFVSRNTDAELTSALAAVGREWVLQVTGKVIERVSPNPKMSTGLIEIELESFIVLNESVTPPFKIEDVTDGGEDLRMKYRYLDLRRKPLQNNLLLRHQMKRAVCNYLDEHAFIEVETPTLIKSTPEGARDFVVPSRMNEGTFYALPQSPQTFKQLLMVAGYDRYYQIVKCFRDEALRADRQPEFTQIDCEMAFVDQEQVINTFEGLILELFVKVLGIEIASVPRMTYDTAMNRYGCDKPDTRFEMLIHDLTECISDPLNPYVMGLVVPGGNNYSRKQIDELGELARKNHYPFAKLSYIKTNDEGYASPHSKFHTKEELDAVYERIGATKDDLVLILHGEKADVLKSLGFLRLELGNRLGLRSDERYELLWVTEFPLLEWDEEEQRWSAMHHPFTSPMSEDIDLLEFYPQAVRAKAYDLVINGVEVGGGSIRIHDRKMQEKMFKLLGFTPEKAKEQFGFLLEAFEYGAPPHGGLAFGFDRLCSLFGKSQSIRDFIAFPKNNHGRDVMIDAPAPIEQKQLDELKLLHRL